MKKIVLLFFGIAILFSCKSTSPVETKLDNKTERMLKGNWVIESVTYPGSDYIKINSFELADSKCFVNSEWQLVSNNNKGTMVLKNTNCSNFSSDITWYINTNNQFVMKVLNADKAKKVRQGYILNVGNVTENSFELLDKVNVGGNTATVIYLFKRMN